MLPTQRVLKMDKTTKKKLVPRAKDASKVNPVAMMSTEIFQWMGDCLDPEYGIILEFGSGYGTHVLLDLGFKVVSIEEDKSWCDKYHNHYVYAPVASSTGWYDAKVVKENFAPYKEIADAYGWSAVIIDGPTVNRSGILPYLDFFGIGLNPVVVDDIDRAQNALLMTAIQHHCQQVRTRMWKDKDFQKQFGPILEKKYTQKGIEGFLEAAIWTAPSETAAIIT